jgi:hypothetical protein
MHALENFNFNLKVYAAGSRPAASGCRLPLDGGDSDIELPSAGTVRRLQA